MGVEDFGRDGEPTRSGAAMDVFVASTHCEIEVGEVYGDDSEGVVGIEEDVGVVVVSFGDDLVDVLDDLAGCEDGVAEDDEVCLICDLV